MFMVVAKTIYILICEYFYLFFFDFNKSKKQENNNIMTKDIVTNEIITKDIITKDIIIKDIMMEEIMTKDIMTEEIMAEDIIFINSSDKIEGWMDPTCIICETNYSTCYTILYKNNKALYKKKNNKSKITNEISILLKAQGHINICELIGIYNEMDILMKYYKLSLYEAAINYKEKGLNQLPDQIKMKIMNEIVSGLSFLHKNQIAHLDLKPDNIMLDDNTVKIIDFGFSKIINDLTICQCGTVGYQPSETYYIKKCDLKKVDIFSLGMLLWSIIMEIEPYTDIPVKHIKSKIIYDEKPNPNPNIKTDQWKKILEIINRCQDSNPIKRPELVELSNITYSSIKETDV